MSLLLPLLASALAGTPAPSLVWTSPSADFRGTMPLGNGEIGLNAWIDPAGDLRFYIARTDCWDEYGRLVKIGALRFAVSGDAGARLEPFRWELSTERGVMSAEYGSGDSAVKLALWVDANRPLIVVETETGGSTQVTASAQLWRNEPTTLPSVETSDIFSGRPEPTVVQPDIVLPGLNRQIGWLHLNAESIGPALCAEIQGVAGFQRPDPLLGRGFGALVSTPRGQRIDDRTLRSTSGRRHVFEIVAHTTIPTTPANWLAEARALLAAAQAVPLAQRRAAHEAWWEAWNQRSWIRLSAGPATPDVPSDNAGVCPANSHAVRLGEDLNGGSRLRGVLGRATWRDGAASSAEIGALAAHRELDPSPLGGRPGSEPFVGRGGLTAECWVKLDELVPGGQRLIDKITPGVDDGFLLDAYPNGSLRCIAGPVTVSAPDVLTVGEWQHVAAVVEPGGAVRLYRNGVALSLPAAAGWIADGSDAEVVTRAYALQRYVRSCAGRGRYPLKFNGSIFTVPEPGAPGDADYRRWGPGYWWQNTRLPYYAMAAAGDLDQFAPLARMYAHDLLPLMVYRTRVNLGQAGAYYPECVYFWGDMFTETYGWQPAAERSDKLQASGWHKWEWVGALELVWLLLDRWEHGPDRTYLGDTILPLAREVLTFFDHRYELDADGHYFMHPAQSLETWWDCDNPMPEIAGLRAVTTRLLALPQGSLSEADAALCKQVAQRVPPLPVRSLPSGEALAPAARFAAKRNIENPELYAVFPFRLCSFDQANADLGRRAYAAREDKGDGGWRQDSVFAAYLGLADEARRSLVKRARSKHAASRFPAFWGPNYDWVPDQDHGSMLEVTLQSMLLQTAGQRIWLLPAWPADWDCDFRLHAPGRTVLEGRVRAGRVEGLVVTPAERAADVVVVGSERQR